MRTSLVSALRYTYLAQAVEVPLCRCAYNLTVPITASVTHEQVPFSIYVLRCPVFNDNLLDTHIEDRLMRT